jgi:hypothetical protein
VSFLLVKKDPTAGTENFQSSDMKRWFKREVAAAGRWRVLASVIFFWAPILLAAIVLSAIWLWFELKPLAP